MGENPQQQADEGADLINAFLARLVDQLSMAANQLAGDLEVAVGLLDEFDRYVSTPDDTGYGTSPFRERVLAFLGEHQ